MAQAVTVELDAQYRQLREECGLFDRSDRGKLLVTGSEAAEYLQGQLTNDIEALEPGQGCYAALLDRKGHMQADMRVLMVDEEKIWIDTEPDGQAVARRHLEMYKIGRDVDVLDAGAERAVVSLIGPRSAELAGSPPLPEHSHEEIAVDGIECPAVGTALGIDLIPHAADRERLIAALATAGAPAVDPAAVEILRIEAGTPRFGRETVARLHYKGRPNRHLRGLRLSAPAAPGAALALGEKEVGTLGSGCVSPTHGPIGLAILRREAEPGAELSLGEDGVTARVVDLPFG
jgi:folate-binding Fe-S cluster repair protein YgfZ